MCSHTCLFGHKIFCVHLLVYSDTKSGIFHVFSRVFPLCSTTCLFGHKMGLGYIKHTIILLFKVGRIAYTCTLIVCHVILQNLMTDMEPNVGHRTYCRTENICKWTENLNRTYNKCLTPNTEPNDTETVRHRDSETQRQ